MQINPEDIIGNRYHKLIVVEYAGRSRRIVSGKNQGWHHYYNCLCDCGRTHRADRESLRFKKTKSCGCLISPDIDNPNTKHPDYHVWLAMKNRCNNLKSDDYKEYGGRGITVCPSWSNSFKQFIGDMGVRTTNGLSIDRIDNDKGYSPDNCRWATQTEQNLNKRNNVKCSYVYYAKNTNKWYTRYTKDNKSFGLGYFTEWWDAVCARKSWENR